MVAVNIRFPRLTAVRIEQQIPVRKKVKPIYMSADAGLKGRSLTLPKRSKANPRLTAEALAEHAHMMRNAKEFTAGITQSFTYQGFYKYEVAIHTTGDVPIVTAAELPPRYEAYIFIEITIGPDGRVAEAKLTNEVPQPTVQKKLLEAIRNWTYIPAKRDGIPIPSQQDLVVHIPT